MKNYTILIFGCILLLSSSLTYSQDTNDKIAFYSNRSGRDDIYIMNADGRNIRLITKGEYGGKCPDLSPDGTRVVFVSMRDGNSELYCWDLASGDEQRLTSLPSVERQPKWSPDGKQIAFQSDRDGNYEIYIMDADGTNWQRLTFTEAEELWPNWSPDGNRIAFSSIRDGNWEIYIVDTDGSDLRRLTVSADNETGATWSPDGMRLAFKSGPPKQFQGDIHVINLDGNNELKLTNFDGVEENPIWSPDGTQIAFQTMKDGNFEIYVMNNDGSHFRNLTDHPAHDYWPSWIAGKISSSIDPRTDNRLPFEVVELHILYDNDSLREGMTPGHGFSCLVKAGDQTLLMDAGADGNMLMSNIIAGGYDPSEIDIIAISHCHADHIGGLPAVMRHSGKAVKLFIPCGGRNGSIAGRTLAIIDSARNMAGDVMYVETPMSISPGIMSTGLIDGGFNEESYIILTDSGAVVITGCAHPGIKRIVHKVIELTDVPILLVIGGFHLTGESKETLDNLATELEGLIKYIAPCHCSGNLARECFRNRFGNRYLEIGVGSVFKLTDLINKRN